MSLLTLPHPPGLLSKVKILPYGWFLQVVGQLTTYPPKYHLFHTPLPLLMCRRPIQGQFMDRYGTVNHLDIILQPKTQVVGYDTRSYITSQIMTHIQMLFKLPISYLSSMGN